MELNENDEIGLPGTSGTSRFAFDLLDTESEEEDVFLEPSDHDLNSSVLIPDKSFELMCSAKAVY